MAEYERSLIRERTRAGLQAAKARGRVGGNPKLKRGDPATAQRLADRQRQLYLLELARTAEEWLPTVRRLRPARTWAAASVKGLLDRARGQGLLGASPTPVAASA